MNKKIIAISLALAMAIPAGLVFNGCGSKNNVVDKEAIFALCATTSARCLVEENLKMQNINTSQTGHVLKQAATSRPESLNAEIKVINSHVSMFENLLVSGGLKPVVLKPTLEEDGDYANLKTKLQIEIPSLSGAKEKFVMYYTEINSTTSEEIEDGENEIETETDIEGFMIYSGQTFEISGEKNIEIENGETESEIVFTTKSKNNPNNYITVKQEIENGEIEMQYSIYENKSLISKSKIEFENEDNVDELKIEFMNFETGKLSNTKITFRKVKNENKIYITFKNGSKKEKILVDSDGTNFYFTYSNGFKETMPRS